MTEMTVTTNYFHISGPTSTVFLSFSAVSLLISIQWNIWLLHCRKSLQLIWNYKMGDNTNAVNAKQAG